MSAFNEMKYILEESLRMLKRRRASNVISVIIMGFSMLVLLIFILVTLNISMVIENAREEMRVYVYLEDGLDQSAVEKIRKGLYDFNSVRGVVFVPKSEALERFREELEAGSSLLDDLDTNPLPNSFEVRMEQEYSTGESMSALAGKVSEWEGVEDVRYGKDWVDRGEDIVLGFYMTDLTLGLIVFLSIVFVISNTVRLSILSGRKSIEILKYVGATNRYIQIPFIFEGAFQGVISAVLAVILLWISYLVGSRYLPGITFFRVEGIAGFVLLCAVLGAAGSYIAIRKYLKR
ncbi:MAG: cell division protein FtsX [Candidatus Krumholzibacteriota bacterium]